jgi:hypothetical protein
MELMDIFADEVLVVKNNDKDVTVYYTNSS